MSETVRQASTVIWQAVPASQTVRQARTVIWSQQVGSGLVRQAPAHVLMVKQGSGTLRQAMGHVLMPNRKLPNAGGAQAILNLVNSEARQVFSYSQISISNPSVSNEVAGCDTVITIGALAGSGYIGTCNLYYSRIPVSRVFASTQFLLPAITAATTVSALLPQINTAYGTYLVASDIIDGPVAAGATRININIASTSYVYEPGGQVILMNTEALTAAIATTALNGFQDARGNIVDPALGVAIARTALLGFTSATGEGPSSNNTSLLLHLDGVTGSTGLVDSAGNFAATILDGATISTARSKFGAASALIGGVSLAQIDVPDNPLIRMAGQDCTIEGWFYMTVATVQALWSKAQGGSAPYNHIATDGTDWYVYLNTNAQVIQAAIQGTVLNTWHHIALVCHNGVWTMYDNGISLGSYSGAASFGNSAAIMQIGNWPSNAPWSGSIDEFRISNVARYTGPFTPPTAPFIPD